MKTIFRNIAVAAAVAAGLTISSCSDMMTLDTGDKAYENAQDTLYSYLGIMRAMQDVAERQVILGEIRGDLVTSSEYATDTLFSISNFDNPQDGSCSMLKVSDYYNVINNCNFYIHYADTSAVKSNVKYMVPEYAQVKTIRAWAYLQLVKNYREVPFITEPINSLDVINNFNYGGNLVNKDNLVDRLLQDGLGELVNVEYPQYGNPSDIANNRWGTWENGSTRISSRLCFIPTNVVLGDLYLLRGASQYDYEQAARYYYQFLRNESLPLYMQYTTMTSVGSRKGYRAVNGWGGWASVYSFNASSNEVVSTIPSAANAGLGKILTRVANIYGYTTTSAQGNDVSTETTTDDSGKETTSNKKDANGSEIYEPSGSITAYPSYKRQYYPSYAYQDVSNNQTYVTHESIELPKYIKNNDSRYGNAIDKTYDDLGEDYQLCGKASSGNVFFYTIPLYRKSLVWLRLAEAINRAGYSKFAFAILKDGLSQYTLPEVRDVTNRVTEDVLGDGTMYYKKVNLTEHKVVYVGDPDRERFTTYQFTVYNKVDPSDPESDSIPDLTTWARVTNTATTTGDNWTYETETHRSMIYKSFDPLYYVTDTLELQNFNKFLNFNDDHWDLTYGIHAKGTGGVYTSYKRTVNGNEEIYRYIMNITGTLDSVYYDFSKMLQSQGVTFDAPSGVKIYNAQGDLLGYASEAAVVNAVENLIVDELALETSFEGNRFTDLVRIASHKNASGYNGTEWLARKIANRNSKAAVGTTPAIDGFDGGIYSKLLNTANWYFSLPSWIK